MDGPQKILSLARLGPLLPTKVASELKTSSIIAGAMLSDLCAKGKLKVSSLKVGGSPLYYIPGNESQLLSFDKHLNEKDQKTVKLLKEQKVIREREVDPLTRVSLAQIKDFARPLIVEYDDVQERFWKWFDVSDSSAEGIIRDILTPKSSEESSPKEEPTIVEKPAELPSDVPAKDVDAKKAEQAEAQKKQVKRRPKSASKSDAWDRAAAFFTKNKVKIFEREVVKKGTDFDLIIEVPSAVGDLQHYCKVRGKKRVNDADLSAAYVQGQIRKLPVIFLTTGELTKKAKEVLPKLKGLTVRQV